MVHPACGRRPCSQGPKDHINTRIPSSGSKAEDLQLYVVFGALVSALRGRRPPPSPHRRLRCRGHAENCEGPGFQDFQASGIEAGPEVQASMLRWPGWGWAPIRPIPMLSRALPPDPCGDAREREREREGVGIYVGHD